MFEDDNSSTSSKSNDFEEEFNNIYDDMKNVFEEYQILSGSKKLSHDFSYVDLIEYKDTEMYNEICPFQLPFLNMLTPVDTLNMEYLYGKECYILPYTLSTSAILPFLIFYLNKSIENELFFIPYIHNYESIFENIFTLLQYSFYFLKKENFILKGYQFQDNKYYLFVEINSFQPSLLNNYTTIIPLVLNELIHTQFYLHYEINPNLCNYFTYNIDNFILKKENIDIEIPIIVYSIHNLQKSEFYSIFGVPKSSEIVNNQYTFFTLEEILQKENIEKNGINRNILFCGKQNYIKLEDYNEEILLSNDSIYLYNHPLYKYIWIAKEYQQQLSLSYHLVKDLLR
jgi:hypothetical protein